MLMKSGYMMALAAMALASGGYSDPEKGTPFIPDTEEDKRLAKEKQQRLLQQKGVKEFTIDGYTVNARDYKNAVRKVNNLKKEKGC